MRRLTPYETNHLIKFGLDPFKIDESVDKSIPVEYITGKAEFNDQIFNVNNKVLIPRVETEELIKIALDKIKNNKIDFADVGTGSGAIGISFALKLLEKQIPFDGYLSDISEKALEVTKLNVDEIFEPKHLNCFTNQIENSKLKVIKSDLLNDYPQGKKFDIIFANLPYIPTERINQLNSSVKDYEPKIALDGGADGLDLIRKLLSQAKTKIKENGLILLEVDDTHDEGKTKEYNSQWEIEIKTDLNNKIRFWICHPL